MMEHRMLGQVAHIDVNDLEDYIAEAYRRTEEECISSGEIVDDADYAQ